ncbi:cell wall-binding repeat-containing protein [Herbiconiux sp. YIM B11900]|uniref:cell wall-binding repeat-containing protein n=1 Tax=Herbiconiux sp. YIM B11900 TaxID=3404131 RepID=UPI003F85E8AF
MHSQRWAHRRALGALVATVTLVATVFFATPVAAQAAGPSASAAVTSGVPTQPDVTGYHAAHIIDDALFYADSTDPFNAGLSVAGVQAVLDERGRDCLDGPRPCLKAHLETTPTVPADGVCAAYPGAQNETVAAMVTSMSAACGISQKALISLLQAESGLVTSSTPGPEDYAGAFAQSCAVTTECDSFFEQLSLAAHRLRHFSGASGSPSAPLFPVGSPSEVPFSSDLDCGSAPLTLDNKATAALYSLTPSQPNAAALAGDRSAACASFVNLDFWATYSDWFGPTRAGVFAVGRVDPVLAADSVINVSGWAIDPSSPGVPISVRLDVTAPSGALTHPTALADQVSAAAVAAHPEAGSAHGFATGLPANETGDYQVCVYALPGPDNTRRDGSHLGCFTVLVSPVTHGSVDQVSGALRIDVAMAIADRAFPFPQTAPVVYVATGYNYPDALSAGPAAAHQGGPLLLTTPDSLSGQTRVTIQRLQPQKIVVVGGPNSVSPAVYDELKVLAPSIVRLGGADRYEASRAVVQYAFGDTGAAQAFVVTGANFPDALSAGGAAGAADAPVVLLPGAAAGVDTPTRSLLEGLDVTSLTVVGGPVSVTPAVVTALDDIAPTARRSGADRFEAAVSVNASFGSSTEVFFATGLNYPDALAGSAWAGRIGAPLYVVQQNCVPRAVLAEVQRLGVDHITLLGGPASLGDGVRNLTACP